MSMNIKAVNFQDTYITFLPECDYVAVKKQTDFQCGMTRHRLELKRLVKNLFTSKVYKVCFQYFSEYPSQRFWNSG